MERKEYERELLQVHARLVLLEQLAEQYAGLTIDGPELTDREVALVACIVNAYDDENLRWARLRENKP